MGTPKCQAASTINPRDLYIVHQNGEGNYQLEAFPHTI